MSRGKMLTPNNVALLRKLGESGSSRFTDLRVGTGQAAKVLSDGLRYFEEQGVVSRTVQDRPLHVHYDLTPKGRALFVALRPLLAWFQEFGSEEYGSTAQHPASPSATARGTSDD